MQIDIINKKYTTIDDRFKVILNQNEIDDILNNNPIVVSNGYKNSFTGDKNTYFHGLLLDKRNNNYIVEMTWDIEGNPVIASIATVAKTKLGINEFTSLPGPASLGLRLIEIMPISAPFEEIVKELDNKMLNTIKIINTNRIHIREYIENYNENVGINMDIAYKEARANLIKTKIIELEKNTDIIADIHKQYINLAEQNEDKELLLPLCKDNLNLYLENKERFNKEVLHKARTMIAFVLYGKSSFGLE